MICSTVCLLLVVEILDRCDGLTDSQNQCMLAMLSLACVPSPTLPVR